MNKYMNGQIADFIIGRSLVAWGNGLSGLHLTQDK